MPTEGVKQQQPTNNTNNNNGQPFQIPQLVLDLPANEKKDTDDDVITQVVGNFGRWQLRTILLIFLCKLPSSWFMACVIYTAPTPKIANYYCSTESVPIIQNQHSNQPTSPVPQLAYQTYGTHNNTKEQQWIELEHPNIQERKTDREFDIDFCSVHENFTPNNHTINPFDEPLQNESYHKVGDKLIPCHKLDSSSEYNSLVSEFDLVCSRKLLISVTQAFHSLGTLVGGLVATRLLQQISPRRLMLIGMLAQIVSGIVTGLVHTFELHIFFRFLTSAFCVFMYSSGQLIFLDITGGKAKTIITTLFELFWSIGLILLPGISIFVDSWTYLYIAISSPTIILVFLHRWITDSPRWLIKHGKIDATLKILLESAAFNNREIPLDLEERLEKYNIELKSVKLSNYCGIWDGETNRLYIIAVHWAWVWSVMLYNSMILYIRAFGVDHIHVNVVILGFAEMLGVFIGLYFILYTRRRWFWVGNLITIAGLLTFFIWLVPDNVKESRRVAMSMILCIGLKFTNASALSILTTCTGEMVTVDKRQWLMFSVVNWSRIWLIVAPFVTTTATFHPLLPISIFASLAVLDGLFMIFLNQQFWNQSQPRIQRVPDLNVYRRNSAILLRRNSVQIDVQNDNNSNNMDNNKEISLSNLRTVSITDIWTACNENIEESEDQITETKIESKKE